MSGHSSHRKFSIKAASDPNSSINITPLVDVVLVLLIIFMVVTPLLEKDIHVRTPSVETTDAATPPPSGQVIVRLATDGTIELNGAAVSENEYVAQLEDKLRDKADRTVFVLSDDAANYGKLVHVLDGAKQAGAQTLGMVTTAP